MTKLNKRSLFLIIKEVVDQQVDIQTITTAKASQTVDLAKIQKQAGSQFFHQLEHDLHDNMLSLAKFLEQLKHDDPDLYNKVAVHFSADKAGNMEELLGTVQQCKTLQELQNLGSKPIFSKEAEGKFYDLGKDWFSKEVFDTAFLYFFFLTSLRNDRSDYWLIKGMCEQNSNMLTEAVNSYTMTIHLKPDTWLAYIYMIHCFILKNDLHTAGELYAYFMREVPQSMYNEDIFLREKLSVIARFIENN